MGILINTNKENVFTLFACFIIFSIVLGSGIVNAKIATMEQIKELNPELADLEYPKTLGGFTFSVNQETGVIEIAQVVFDSNVGWYPWFIQEEDKPFQTENGDFLYAQKLYLAEYPEIVQWTTMISYEKTFNLFDPGDKSVFDLFGDPLPLNFKELWPVMGLDMKGPEVAEKLRPPITEDGRFVFYCPPGPGIGFLIEEESGDIYALLRIQQEEETDLPSPLKKEADHPDLGNFFYTGVLVRDPGNKFDMDNWAVVFEDPDFQLIRRDVIEEGDTIEPGFVLQKLVLEKPPWGPQFILEIEVLNNTGQTYQAGIFEIEIFDHEGYLIEEHTVFLSDSEDGTVTSFPVPLNFEEEIDPEGLMYSIEFVKP